METAPVSIHQLTMLTIHAIVVVARSWDNSTSQGHAHKYDAASLKEVRLYCSVNWQILNCCPSEGCLHFQMRPTITASWPRIDNSYCHSGTSSDNQSTIDPKGSTYASLLDSVVFEDLRTMALDIAWAESGG